MSDGRTFRELAVIGAGNMGSGIAQKMATEGFAVTLVDLDDARVERGMGIIRRTLDEGVERKLFRPEHAAATLDRVRGTSDWQALAHADLVVEAVFEDYEVKLDVFRRLDEVCRPDAILATNTSSMSVTRLAEATRHPERVVGLHYFFHPAKNRLVEVVAGRATDPDVLRWSWALQEQLGKTPIASADVAGFVVNRFFVPWLNEAVRLLEEGVADIPTIEQACKQTFKVGMGPFELMNVTGVPIALHAATTLGHEFGPFYAPSARLKRQVEAGTNWSLFGDADTARLEQVDSRMLGSVFFVAGALVDEGVGTLDDTDIGARVGLRWPKGPFEMMNRLGLDRAAELVGRVAERWDLEVPTRIAAQADAGRDFEFEVVKSEITGGVATLTINRPDALNALNELVVDQLQRRFRDAAADPAVRGIVIAGAGKAFIAGADIRFFVRNIDAGDLERIVRFTRAGHELLADIQNCAKPVIARLHGLALGGGLELALACHRIVASPRASMAFPETGIGIYPGLGGTQRTPRRVGTGLAKWLIYTGQMVGAEQALGVGLVDRVVPHADLDRVIADEIARGTTAGPRATSGDSAAIAAFFDGNSVADIREQRADTGGDETLARAAKQVGFKAPIALALTEKLIDEGIRGSLDAGLELELEHLVEIFRTADAYEGLSTLGKRRPVFAGR